MQSKYFVLRLSAQPKVLSGPIHLSDLYESVKSAKHDWTDLAYEPGGSWQRLYDIPALRLLMPEMPIAAKLDEYTRHCLQKSTATGPAVAKAAPTSTPLPTVLPPSVPAIPSGGNGAIPRLAPIYLWMNGAEQGPVNHEIARNVLAKMQPTDSIYIWYRGLKAWVPVQELPEFAYAPAGPSQFKKLSEELTNLIYAREHRAATRQGMVAVVRWKTKDGSVRSGVCIDVSQTGMQVRLPQNSGLRTFASYAFEVVPISLLQERPFPFEGRVVWENKKSDKIGINFTRFPEADGRDRLNRLVKKIEAGLSVWKPPRT